MKARYLIATTVALAGAALGLAQSAAGNPVSIEVSDNDFTPAVSQQTVASGGVTWSWSVLNNNQHNVRQDDKLFYSGVAQLTGDFQRDPSAGKFPYYCEVHGNGVMDGLLKVKPLYFESGDPSDQFGVRWAEATHHTGNLFDVRYKGPGTGGDYVIWRQNITKDALVFGANDKPVDVRAGKEYRFQARSKDSSTPSRRSGWSPPLVVD